MTSRGRKERTHAVGPPHRDGEMATAMRMMVIVAAALVLRVLVAQHVNFAGDAPWATGLNGSRFWCWPWRTDRAPFARLLACMVVALVPMGVAFSLLWQRPASAKRARHAAVVALLVLGSFAMQMAAMAGGDGNGSLGRVGQIVRSEAATSYYNDAAALVRNGVTTRQLLGNYPQWLDESTGHNRNKPPAPTLYFRAWISVFGDSLGTAQRAGMALGALAALTAAATYGLVLCLGFDAVTAMCAALFWTLCPGPIVMWPELDQVYGLFTCAIVGAWALGLRAPKTSPQRAMAWGAAAGLLMAIGLFTTYALLVLVFTLASLAVGSALFDSGGRRRMIHVAAAAAAAFVAFYVLLWLAVGFDPITTFFKIHAVQNANLVALKRTWPDTIGWDLLDFTLCCGWLGCLLAGMFLLAGVSRWRTKKTGWIAATMIVQIVLIALTGVLQSEVTRLWIFVLPLLAVVVGLELRQWDRSFRLAVFLCMWILLVTVVANIQFILLE